MIQFALAGRRWIPILTLLSSPWILLTGAVAAQGPTPLAGIERVLFLGDSITYGGRYIELIDVYFVTRFPERQVEFLNLGLPSETVSGLSEPGHANGEFPRPDLHERLGRVLAETKPDLVIACYGMNDGIYMPFAPDRFAKFKDGLLRLRQAVTGAGAKIIHITPPVFDEVRGGNPGYAAALDRYADWMLDQRAQGWNVVDLYRPMNEYLIQRRKSDPAFCLAGDGVHPNEIGHWIMAKQILLHLGATDLAAVEEPGRMLAGVPGGGALLKLVEQRQRLLKDSWLTATGHKRPGMSAGLPLAEAQKGAGELQTRIREQLRR
jgi:lysophospholipase L1-like esterase